MLVQLFQRLRAAVPLRLTVAAGVSVAGRGFNGEGNMHFTLAGDRISRLVIT